MEIAGDAGRLRVAMTQLRSALRQAPVGGSRAGEGTGADGGSDWWRCGCAFAPAHDGRDGAEEEGEGQGTHPPGWGCWGGAACCSGPSGEGGCRGGAGTGGGVKRAPERGWFQGGWIARWGRGRGRGRCRCRSSGGWVPWGGRASEGRGGSGAG